MRSEIQVRLLRAVSVSLSPLIRILLRCGITYRQFDDIVRWTFVKESFEEVGAAGKRTNISRVAVRTGLSRKEVARLHESTQPEQLVAARANGTAFHSGQAARVLQIWHTDAKFLLDSGKPRDLSFDSEPNSFSALVKAVGGDVPAGAVRAELIAAGAVEESSTGLLKVLKRYFIPGDVTEDLVVGFQHLVAPLLLGLVHNATATRSEAFIQRVAFSDSLSAIAVRRFREMAQDRAAEFVQSMDEWLGANESNAVKGLNNEDRVGIGVFYFESPEFMLRAEKKEP